MSNKIVARFKVNEDTSKIDYNVIEFYKIITHYKSFTILKYQSEGLPFYYVYDNKTSSLGRLIINRTEKDINVLITQVKNNKIIWLYKYNVFFEASSPFVVNKGLFEYPYGNLIDVYMALMDIRRVGILENEIVKTIPNRYVFKKIRTKLYLLGVRKVRKKVVRKAKNKLGVIW